MGDVIVRDPAEAAASAHDLIVVGGGVYGTMLTLEAARRGLRPLLVERSDFGSQTTENSLRIVHGGLRYLQTMDLRRFRESVRERAWLLETFPGHVRPLECFMPLYGEGLRRRWVFAVALALNEGLARLGGGRNELPPGRTLGPEEAGRVLGIVPGGGLTGAAVWYDAVMEDSERVVIEALHAACDHGARALNYVEATELRVEHGEVSGVRGLDRRTGRDHAFRAPVVINAAGPWARRLGASFDRDLPALWRPTLAFNLALRADAPLPGALAVAPRPPGRPTYFLHPWKGGILAGTHHSPAPEDPNAGPEPEVVDELREAMARAAPGLELLRAEVARVYWGLLPGRPGKRLGLATRPVVVEHGRRGGPRGLVSVSGVKFTTARAVAESVLRRIWGRDLRPAVPVNGRDALDVERARARLTADGWDAPASRRLLEDLVARESVVTREDLVERRLGWGPFRDPPEALEVPGLGGRGEEDLTEAPVRP